MPNRFFSNLFTGQQEEPRSFLGRDTFAPSYQDEEPEEDPRSFFNFRRQETPALSAYRQHLASQPQYDQFRKTDTKNKIGAALAGVGAMLTGGDAYQATSQHLEIPWQRALYDYKLKGSGLKEQAAMEAEDQENAYKYWNAGQKSYQDFLEHQRKVTKDQSDMTNDATRTQNDTARTANQGRYYGGLIRQGDDRNELTRQANQNLAGYRTGMLGVARQNAGTNEKRTNSYTDFLKSRQQNLSKGKVPDVRDQDFAEQTELGRLAQDPAWSPFIIPVGADPNDPSSLPRYILSPGAPTHIKNQLQERVRNRFTSGYNVYGDDENSPYELEEIPELFPSH